jgi:hypothetical protein
MSEPRVSELTKALGVLTERMDGLGHTLDARFQAADRRIDDLRREVNQRLDDLRQHFDRRLDDAQKLSTWVLGLLVAIALLLAKIAFWP